MTREGALILLLFTAAGAGAAPRAVRPRAYPLHLAGLRVGHSNDNDVRRLYGPGLFVANEGHLGGRYYVSPRQDATLHVELGVDRLIEAIEYRRGIRLPGKTGKQSTALKQARSPKLRADSRLEGDVRLGDPTASVLAKLKLGKPKHDRRHGASRTLRYETDYQSTPNVLFYDLTLTFEQDHLTAIRLYNGD